MNSKHLRVALVHDYLNEFGGAERVLLALSELYPEAPIYTAFYRTDSPAYARFKDKNIVPSWAQRVPFFAEKLHSPLRFLAPLIWESFNFDDFDVVISSSGWYITKGILTRPKTVHISYIHTPPRYLYGYNTAVEWQKYGLVRAYAHWVNKGLRAYDYLTAARADVLVANSREVRQRIAKFWRRESVVINPPVEIKNQELRIKNQGERGYFLTGGRLVAAKHFDIAIRAANELKLPLKVYGSGPMMAELSALAGPTVTMLSRVDDKALAALYAGARAFVALADDEDFGMTPVEAMAYGTPVLAYRGGGYVETVTNKTGVFVETLSVDAVKDGMRRIQRLSFTNQDLRKQAALFSKDVFCRKIKKLVEETYALQVGAI